MYISHESQTRDQQILTVKLKIISYLRVSLVTILFPFSMFLQETTKIQHKAYLLNIQSS